MKKILIAIITLTVTLSLCLGLIACSASVSESSDNKSAIGSDSSSGSPGYVGGYPTGDDYVDEDSKFENGTAGDSSLAEDRKIIKTVNQSLQTEDFNAVIDNVNALVSELGGYISNSYFKGESYYNKDSLRSATLTVKIPAQKLSDFVSRAEKNAVVVKYNESVSDVTNAYIDIESRIAVYEAEEIALLEMLEASPDINTMLSIRSRLNEVQYSLASLRAQKNNYDNRIEYSTVHLDIDEVRQAVSRDPGFFEEIGDNFSDSLYGIGRFFRSLAVWFIGDFLYILLWGIVIGLALFLVLRIRKRRKRDKVIIIKNDKNTDSKKEQ